MQNKDIESRNGFKRPYIPSESAAKVEMYAARYGLDDREAYREIIDLCLNEQGDLKGDHIQDNRW
jgi:hypothetical protein